jgi:hypothetical protein
VIAQLADVAGLVWKRYTAPEGFDTAEALLDQAGARPDRRARSTTPGSIGAVTSCR